MHKFKKMTAALLVVCLVLGGSFSVFAATADASLPPALEKVIAETAAYLLETVPRPRVGLIGGEWAVIGLARSGYAVPPNWFATYYQNLQAELVKKQGVLHDKKYTEYARAVLALTALGKDPADVGGYNLLAGLGDFDRLLEQGINGPILALLALDAGNYAIPACPEAQLQATRDLLQGAIVKRQLPDGGFSLGGERGDPDVTAMALQALAPYRGDAEIKAVIDRALACLSRLQNIDGGYSGYWDAENVESVVQVLVALTALGIDPAADSRFIKQGHTVVDYLLLYAVPGGGFKHILAQSGPDGMASEQAFYSLVAYERFLKGEKSLYAMSDVCLPGGLLFAEGTPEPLLQGLPGKDPAVTARPGCHPGKTFADIKGEQAQAAVEALAARGIISGSGEALFEPLRTMTRAEFTSIVVRALGLAPGGAAAFTDVAATSWYAAPVATAHAYGIVSGVSATAFSPEGSITREQAAVMVVQAAGLCGMDTALGAAESLDLLAQFTDYTSSSAWAREALAVCYKYGLLSPDVLQIKPQAAITRGEIAGMIYRMLLEAALL